MVVATLHHAIEAIGRGAISNLTELDVLNVAVPREGAQLLDRLTGKQRQKRQIVCHSNAGLSRVTRHEA